jgi:hypothetical protein
MLANIDKKTIIPSSIFFKAKKNGEGFELKGRLVAGGHRQNEELYPKQSSPTVTPQSILILCAHAAENFWFVATMDVKCAYLNASREGQPMLHIRLRGLVARRFVELAPAYRACYDPRSDSLLAIAAKAIYGTVEAANLWYQEVLKTLTSLGYSNSDEDPCLFFKDDIKIGLYVDDFLVTAKRLECINELHQALVDRYDSVKINIGSNLQFLGMELTFLEASVCAKIDISDLVRDIDGVSANPCGMNLFPHHLLILYAY